MTRQQQRIRNENPLHRFAILAFIGWLAAAPAIATACTVEVQGPCGNLFSGYYPGTGDTAINSAITLADVNSSGIDLQGNSITGNPQLLCWHCDCTVYTFGCMDDGSDGTDNPDTNTLVNGGVVYSQGSYTCDDGNDVATWFSQYGNLNCGGGQ